MPASLYDRIAVGFLYNTSKITSLILSLPFRGESGGGCKQRSGQTPLPCLYPHRGEGVYLKRFLILFFKLPLALRAAAMRAAASLPALVRWSRRPS